MTTSSTKAIFFLGATGGCGLSTLRRSLAAGHMCIALCRTPARLLEKLTPAEQTASNLRIEEGNAHDPAAVARCLVHPSPSTPNNLVDVVVFSIGSAFSLSKWVIEDPDVCRKGMQTLLNTLADCRKKGMVGRPRVVAVSSTGLSDFSRDVPLLCVPLYHVLLKSPHEDKRAMEAALVASEEDWTVARASLLTDGPESTKKPVREGMEDPRARVVESKAIGYTISREDVGKWIFENIIEASNGQWVGKIATITY
jgi:hypothetical protein